MKIAINTSNLHLGGGIQVAVSFLHTLLGRDDAREMAVFASTEVDRNLRDAGADPRGFGSRWVHDAYGRSAFLDPQLRQLDDAYLGVTAVGPADRVVRRARRAVGVAQARARC